MRYSPETVSTPNRKTGRRCGDCTLCCQAIAVYELGKPTGVPCRHVAECGCSIYPCHPAECQDFDCLWLQGWFDTTDRPDTLGVVFFMDCGLVCVTESSPGASENPRVQEIVTEILEAGISVVVRNATGVKKTHPDGTIERALVDESDPFKVNIRPETVTFTR